MLFFVFSRHVFGGTVVNSRSIHLSRFKMLSFNECDAVGFDMDHTLCRYDLLKLSEFTYKNMVKLSNERNGLSDVEVTKAFQDITECIFSGTLLFDIQHGTFLKLDCNGKIVKASLHQQFLSNDEISKIYPGCIYPHFPKLHNNIFTEPSTYSYLDDNFCLSSMAVLNYLIMQQKVVLDNPEKTYSSKYIYFKIFKNYVDGIYKLWDWPVFEKGTSPYFEELKKHPEYFLIKCSENLKSWLLDLRRSGKKVFLLTSSHCDYAQLVMNYCVGEDWRDYFDLIISKAKKPRFFKEQYPFIKVDPDKVCEVKTDDIELLEQGGWYSEGNCDVLMKSFQSWTGKPDPKVVYCGDSLKSDIIYSKLLYNWEAVFIMDSLRTFKETACAMSKEEEDLFFSSNWGPVLTCSSKDLTGTFYGQLISGYSSIAVPSVEDIAIKSQSTNHYFPTFSSNDLNGYYPKLLTK